MSLNAEVIAAALNAIPELVTALNRNNELLTEAAEGRERVLEAAKNASAPKATAAKKGAEKVAEKATEQAAAATTETAADADVPTIEQVNAAITKYGAGTDRAEERDARVAKIQEIIGKVKIDGHTGALNAAAIKPEMREVFIKTMEDFCTRPDLTEPAAAADSASALLG